MAMKACLTCSGIFSTLTGIAARFAELRNEQAVARIDAQGDLQRDMPQLLHSRGGGGDQPVQDAEGQDSKAEGEGGEQRPGGAASG
jgi:hypothetical protein